MVPYIPLELVDLVASFALTLDDDSDSEARRRRSKLAANLSLVCRAWRALGQDHLSRTLELYDGQPDLDSLLGRPHLLTNVRELVVISVAGEPEMIQSVARCRDECRRLRKLALKLDPAGYGGRFPDFAAPAPWSAVKDLVIGFRCIWTWIPLQAILSLFPLDRLSSLDIKVPNDPAELLPLLQNTTSLSHLSLGLDKRDLMTFARELSPVLAAMTSLETFSLRYHMDSTRVGGLRAFPPSLLDALPLSLRIVDIDLGVTGATLGAVQAFLAQRVDEALERWTTTATPVRAEHEEQASVVCVKVGSMGERRWVLQ
ncbi:hypothetical protein JCM3775_005163 [Rhodotorula graminis]